MTHEQWEQVVGVLACGDAVARFVSGVGYSRTVAALVDDYRLAVVVNEATIRYMRWWKTREGS